MPENKKVDELFDEWAQSSRGKQMEEGHLHLFNTIFGELAPNASSALLDVGCGTGKALMKAQEVGFQFLAGLDISEGMVALTRSRLPNANVVTGDAENLPWEVASFTHVFSNEALYYLPAPERFFQEAFRVLVPGGRIDICIEFFEENSGSRHWDEAMPVKLYSWTEAEWVSWMEQAGFSLIQNRRIKVSTPDYANFSSSPFFPKLEDYQAYFEEGALWISGFKPQ